jgi:hypothetical protein
MFSYCLGYLFRCAAKPTSAVMMLTKFVRRSLSAAPSTRRSDVPTRHGGTDTVPKEVAIGLRSGIVLQSGVLWFSTCF